MPEAVRLPATESGIAFTPKDKSSNIAPIALFVYNGMEHTLRAANSLQENEFASRTVIQLILPGQMEPRVRQDGQNGDFS